MKIEGASLQRTLKNRGYRITRQRQVVLEVLRSTNTHPDAHWIYQRVRRRMPQVSLGTIYRTLGVLKETGLIQELSYGSSFSRYDGTPENHYHIGCIRCGKVADVDLPLLRTLEKRIKPREDFKVTGHRLEFSGICGACQ